MSTPNERIALVSFAADTSLVPEFNTIRDLVLPQREAYCKRHGYQHWHHHGTNYDGDSYYAIQRLVYVHDRLSCDRAEVVWILNLAAVITNTAIEMPISEGVCITRDPNGLNAGSMIFHKSDHLLEWLECIIDAALETKHPWYEQHIIQETENSPLWSDLYHVLSHPSINQRRNSEHGWPDDDPQNWKPGDFVIHFPGIPLLKRIELVRWALTQVV